MIDQLIAQADERRRGRDHRGAVEILRRALAIDPDHARAHAALAWALVGLHRLHGAQLEASLALALDGNDDHVHYVAAVVAFARRELDTAWSHVAVAIAADPDDPHHVDARILGAEIRRLQRRYDDARELIDEALALAPNHVDALTDRARLELELGNLAEATDRITAALAADPASYDAHLAAGSIALARGDVSHAEDHARFASRIDPNDPELLRLWTGIKARRSVVLGLWWRFNTRLATRGERSRVGLLVGMFFIANLAILLAGALRIDWLERLAMVAWLGFCAYTWFAPSVFRWMMQRETSAVVLRPDY